MDLLKILGIFFDLERLKKLPWWSKLILIAIILIGIIIYGRWHKDEIQRIPGAEGVKIGDLKAGRDINISIDQNLKEKATQDLDEAPFIYAEPVEFILYKPSNPQAPGQEKAWIKIRLTNQSTKHTYNAHINFITNDGTGHKANSDSWNTQMGTKSLYTFNSMSPGEKKYAVWRPDVPPDYEQTFKTDKFTFNLALYITWEDMKNNKYSFLSLSELRYNKELNIFLFEVKETYNGLYDKEKIKTVLDEMS